MGLLTKGRKLQSIAIVSIALVVLLCFFWKPLRIYQHSRGVERAWELMQYRPTTFNQSGIPVSTSRKTAWEAFVHPMLGIPEVASERYDYHLDALVKLGHFEHRDFHFKHIRAKTSSSKKLWELLTNKFPNHNHVSMNFEDAPAVVSVWDTSARMPLWNEFVSQHDLPDFETRFMKSTNKEANNSNETQPLP